MEEATPFNILLPYCIESDVDVFQIILKASVARSTLDDHYLVSAFKSGMTGEAFTIEPEDISVNWNELKSESHQIRQSRLLGLWTIKSFPSLGKKLFGDSYRAPKRNAVAVTGTSVIEPDSIDDFIFPKMKLRLIHLSVSESTIKKLKHFVRAPGCIGKKGELRITRKMRSFEVNTQFLDRCWEALKFGELSMSSDFERQIHSTLPVNPCVESSIEENQHFEKTCENDLRTVPLAKRPCRNSDYGNNPSRVGDKDRDGGKDCERKSYRASVDTTNGGMDDDSNTDLRTVPLAKRPCRNSDHGNNPSRVGEKDRDGGKDCERESYRASVDTTNGGMDDDSNTGSLRDIILQMQHDLRSLKKAVEDSDSERLNVMIVKQKDEEIAQTKESAQRMVHENEILMNSQSNLQKKIEEQTDLINDLSKRLAKSETEHAASLDLIEQLKSHVQDLERKLAEAEIQLNEWKRNATIKDNELTQVQIRVEDLSGKLVENEKQLDDWKQYGACKDNERIAIHKLHEKSETELAASRYLVEQLKSEMAAKDVQIQLNTQLKSQVQDLDRKLAEAEMQLNQWQQYAVVKDDELIAANKTLDANKKLQDEITVLKNRSGCIVAELQRHIERLDKDLSAAGAVNSDSIKRTEQLEQELNVLKMCGASKDEELELLKNRSRSNVATQTGTYNEMNSSELLASALSTEHVGDPNPEPIFETKDKIVRECREKLLQLQFGWVKFHEAKSSTFSPSFVHLDHTDGKFRAQKVTADGYVSNSTNEFFEFKENSDDIKNDRQHRAQKYILNKFNTNFRTSFK